MARRVVGLLAITVMIGVLSGCTSRAMREYPVSDMRRTIYPEAASVPESELDDWLTRRVTLRAPVRAAVVWIGDGSEGAGALLPDGERTRLVETLAAALGGTPFGAVTVVPTALRARSREALEQQSELDLLRGAAARFQSDVLIALDTQANQYTDPNLLVPSYVAIVPILFVPGHDVAVYASAEACAIDVRTGVFLACAQGHGEATRGFVTVLGRERRLRELAVEAYGDALAALPDTLRSRLGSWLALAGNGSPRAVGMVYETVAP
jgi:rhombotail lipoprotein